ncbi:MAG: protein translocase subunit SecF [bacterium]
MGLKLIPENTSIRFTQIRIPALVFSGLAILISLFAFFSHGLNYGIDFRGGATIEVGPAENTVFTEDDLTKMRSAVGELGLGDVKVTLISDLTDASKQGMILFLEQQPADHVFAGYCAPFAESATGDAGESAQQIATSCVKQLMKDTLGDGITERKTDVVGPAVSHELIEKGVIAVILSVISVLFYIWFRFEWQFSVGAIVALVHDVILTIGMFSMTSLEFNLSIIAALLTIVGYSLNDTVVVYDRVRENLRKFKKRDLDDILDMSINQTLTRTIMTSLTTLLALGALYLFGGTVLRGFTAAMIWGVVVGTYSSIFVASPLLHYLGVKRDWSTEVNPALPN